MRPALFFVVSLLAWADERTQRLAKRLSEEADAFQRLAPQMIAEETLTQVSLKPPARFRPRVGDAARKAPQWRPQKRVLRSEYSFGTFSSEGGSIHELRQVIEVDGKPIQDKKKAQEALARAVMATEDQRKKQLLKDFEKHGLLGAATDFGQMILFFTPRGISQFEFTFLRREIKYQTMLVFSYAQIDGKEGVTIVDGRNDRATKLRAAGEIWVLEDTYQPVAITLSISRPAGASFMKEEATVNYALSEHGVVVPTSTIHKETQDGKTLAENEFHYSTFKRFGASSDLKFEVEPEELKPQSK